MPKRPSNGLAHMMLLVLSTALKGLQSQEVVSIDQGLKAGCGDDAVCFGSQPE